jgi:hypothetical protein
LRKEEKRKEVVKISEESEKRGGKNQKMMKSPRGFNI